MLSCIRTPLVVSIPPAGPAGPAYPIRPIQHKRCARRGAMPSRWSERRKKFRAVIGGSQCVRPASVHDPISARIAADLGFETGMFAGSVASLTVLGAPDLIVLTLSEFAEQA